MCAGTNSTSMIVEIISKISHSICEQTQQFAQTEFYDKQHQLDENSRKKNVTRERRSFRINSKVARYIIRRTILDGYYLMIVPARFIYTVVKSARNDFFGDRYRIIRMISIYFLVGALFHSFYRSIITFRAREKNARIIISFLCVRY